MDSHERWTIFEVVNKHLPGISNELAAEVITRSGVFFGPAQRPTDLTRTCYAEILSRILESNLKTSTDDHFEPVADPPSISVVRIVHVLQHYRAVILLSLMSVAIAYLIVALAIYLSGPADRVTSLPFRLDFEGAGAGKYPNGTRFNVTDIISGPILLKTYEENGLNRYTTFGDFSRSIFVLEANREYEALAADYAARIADPKLSSVDRERLQREFDLKRESIAKNSYSVNYTRPVRTKGVPEPIVRKVLLNILKQWADFAVNQQRVTTYQVSVLTPEIVAPDTQEQNNLIAAVHLLRVKAVRAMENIGTIESLPGAKLARTPDRTSLQEVRLRVEDIIRFRLEPLVDAIRASGLAPDQSRTSRFVENQLAYDERQLRSAQNRTESIRQAIAMYETPVSAEAHGESTTRPLPNSGASGGESVMPQLSDTFLDRLLTLSGRGADVQYRQKLVDDYRRAAEEMIPLQWNVAYDLHLRQQIASPAPGGARLDPASVRAQIEATRMELRQLITKMNELFAVVSRNMTPSSLLFTVGGAPAARTARSFSLERLALYGVLLLLLSFPLIIAVCFLHSRMREEELDEERQVLSPGA